MRRICCVFITFYVTCTCSARATDDDGCASLSINIAEMGNKADIFFQSEDTEVELAIKARDFMNRFGLLEGSGCENAQCVEDVLVQAMQQHIIQQNQNKIESNINLHPNFEELYRSDIWASVPCVPPYCSFQCARIFEENKSLTETEKNLKAFQWIEEYPMPRQCPNGIIHSIGHAIPEESVVDCVPVKTVDFAMTRIASGNYQFTTTEEHEYKRQIRSAFYAHTKQKMGWEATRHYEILSSGTAPFFSNLSSCPHYSLPRIPKKLIQELMTLPGISQNTGHDSSHYKIDMSVFPIQKYYELMDSLLRITRMTLTTKAMVEDMMMIVIQSLIPKIELTSTSSLSASSIIKPVLKKVLFLSGDGDHSDYQRDIVLHGLHAVFGSENVIGHVSPSHMFRPTNGVDTHQTRAKLHGLGYAISGYLTKDSTIHHPNTDFGQNDVSLKNRIINHEFDVVIYGSVRRGMPFWDIVRQSYEKNRIVFVEGEDLYTNYQTQRNFSAMCALLHGQGHYFLREMPATGCPEAFP